jgi:hypothetical protein
MYGTSSSVHGTESGENALSESNAGFDLDRFPSGVSAGTAPADVLSIHLNAGCKSAPYWPSRPAPST